MQTNPPPHPNYRAEAGNTSADDILRQENQQTISADSRRRLPHQAGSRIHLCTAGMVGHGLAVLAALALLLGCTLSASAQNLVTNPGFETGDLTGWTFTPAASGSAIYVDFGIAHSGNWIVSFGATGSDSDTITQEIPTVPGATYTFSFWLRDEDATDLSSYFTASWDASPVLDITPTTVNTDYGWTQFSYTVTASSSTTTIGFSGRDSAFFVDLDDVSVIGPTDTDGDGVADEVDDCPNSLDVGTTIHIDGCDTGVPNPVFDSGCTLSDLIAEIADSSTNHGQFVSGVVHLTNALRQSGELTKSAQQAIQNCTAHANLP